MFKVVEPRPAKSRVVPELPRFALRNRPCDFKGKVPEISKKFLGIKYGKILFNNFAILIRVIRLSFAGRHLAVAEYESHSA